MMRSLFPPSSEAALLAALKLLDRLDPSFAARLRLPVSTVSIVIKDGVPHRLLGRGSLPLTMAPSEIQAALSALPSEGPLLIFGIGTGELLVEALKKYPERQIAAWTRDPLEWRLVLSRHNLQKALSSRRLTPVLEIGRAHV